MIDILNKSECCGCGACLQACLHHCIDMCEDDEGFLYPHVHRDICVNCELCKKVCPILNTGEPREPLKVYAAKNPDEEIRLESSSGGVFSMLAEKIIDQGGIVFGAMWNEKWEVVHGSVEKKEDISVFRGSKYVQSRIGNAFKVIKDYLNNGRKVLFSGTPCQVAGLRLYLHKEYENLLTVDFVCHGVPSPGVFRWHLQEELNNYARSASKNTVSLRPIYSIPKGNVLLPEGIGIQDIRFRDKKKGWKKYGFALDLTEATAGGEKNSVSLFKYQNNYTFLKGMNYYLRPSCYECKYRSLRSGSDITIADYWGIQALLPDYEDDKGVSAIIVNSEKAKQIIDLLKLDKVETSFQDIKSRNSSLEHSASLNTEKRQFIFDRSINKSFKARVDEITKVPFLSKLKGLPRVIVYGIFGENRIMKIRKKLSNVHS